MAKVDAIPKGQEGATPYLSIKGAAAALEFYKKAFGAVELVRMDQDGKIGHAEMKIAGALIYLADEFPEIGAVSPKTLGGSSVTIAIYVENIDAFASKAVASGAKLTRPVEDQFYGDRAAQFEDPFGHRWWFATHVEDVSPEEMERRAKLKK